MKILWLAHRDPLNPKRGGSELIIYEVGKRLVKYGNDVTILSGGWKNCEKILNLDGIKIIRFGSRVVPHIALPLILLRNRYDIVIADLGHAVPWVSPILLKKKTVVSFLHLHARSLPGQVGKALATLITAIEKLYFIFYHELRFVTISQTSFDDLIALGIKSKNISMINPGVNSELFKPSRKTENSSIIYFGGMRPYKRPEEALYLLRNLLCKNINVTLTIVGDGPSKEGLERLSIELNIKDYVIFTGAISREKLSALVSSSWLNIHSSVTEGWGISIVEAASAGTPTVAYKVAGVSDSIKNGINGITVKDGDRESLTNAALTILEAPEKWWSSSLEVAKKYSWDHTAELWDKLIHEILNE
ncbi:MAG: glycosyltransferase family 4 protein [Thermoplasmataceae archaeon]